MREIICETGEFDISCGGLLTVSEVPWWMARMSCKAEKFQKGSHCWYPTVDTIGEGFYPRWIEFSLFGNAMSNSNLSMAVPRWNRRLYGMATFESEFEPHLSSSRPQYGIGSFVHILSQPTPNIDNFIQVNLRKHHEWLSKVVIRVILPNELRVSALEVLLWPGFDDLLAAVVRGYCRCMLPCYTDHLSIIRILSYMHRLTTDECHMVLCQRIQILFARNGLAHSRTISHSH